MGGKVVFGRLGSASWSPFTGSRKSAPRCWWMTRRVSWLDLVVKVRDAEHDHFSSSAATVANKDRAARISVLVAPTSTVPSDWALHRLTAVTS